MKIRIPSWSWAFALTVTTACATPAPEIPSPLVLLSSDLPIGVTGGQIQGSLAYDDPEVAVFKGIPFAAPPLRELRWQPPKPVIAWDGVRDATAAGPICMQGGNQGQSEDCLFLNVWAPRESITPRPVMVWIHGGGFVSGSGSDALTDGTRLASQGVIVVTLNYRLGPFGFLAHPVLSAESTHNASGNYGLLDIVAALEWIQDNVEKFGGDPDRVTLFGQSAGGGAIMSVMLMPQSRGLFHRAIAESTFITGWDRRLRQTFGGMQAAEAQGTALVDALETKGSDPLTTMRSATPAEVFQASNKAGFFGLAWAPNVDDWSIPDDPVLMYENGRQHQVPLITGLNGNEGSLMTAQMSIDSVDAFESFVHTSYPSIAEQAIVHYGVTSAEQAKPGIDHLFHDMWIAGPVTTLANHHANSTAPTWLYHFPRVPPTEMGTSLGSHHSAEIPYVFGNLLNRGNQSTENPVNHPMMVGDWTELDHMLSEAMMDHWTQFSATGDPNREGLTEWPAFTETAQFLRFTDRLEIDTELYTTGFSLYTNYQKARQ